MPKRKKVVEDESDSDEMCSICLGKFVDKSVLDKCLHFYCFECIKMWSKKQATCPLCMKRFKVIQHGWSDFDCLEYRVETTTDAVETSPQENGLIQHLPGTPTDLRFNRNDHQQHLQQQQYQYQQLHQQNRNELFQEILEATTDFTPSRNHRHVVNIGSPENVSQEENADIVTRHDRRKIYENNLWAKEIQEVAPGRKKNISPTHLTRNPASCLRLERWLSREIPALVRRVNDEEVMNAIMRHCKKVHMTSVWFYDRIKHIFGDKTRHFIHEFDLFASSLLELEEYDERVEYGPPEVHEIILDSESDEEAIEIIQPPKVFETMIQLSEDDDDDDEEVVDAAEIRQIHEISLQESASNTTKYFQNQVSKDNSSRKNKTESRKISVASWEPRIPESTGKMFLNKTSDDDISEVLPRNKLKSVIGLNLLGSPKSQNHLKSKVVEVKFGFKKHHSGHKNKSKMH